MHRPQRYQTLLKQAQAHSMNTVVLDVQPRMPTAKTLQQAQQRDFYLVARIVVFPGGLAQYPLPSAQLQTIYKLVEKSAQIGFDEIQLDYIRFADRAKIGKLSIKKRYAVIESVLCEVQKRLQKYQIPWGADLFGRIAFNRNDRIGQKLELFAKYVDTIYPMLYPSHFYGMPQKINDPYRTILTGIQNSKRRTRQGARTRIVAYIQAFKMKIAPSGLSYIDYIYKQLQASADAGGAGYIAWNARNHYAPFFQALTKYQTLAAKTQRE